MIPLSFVSPRHRSRGHPRSFTGLQSGQAIVTEGAERPVIKVYFSIFIYLVLVSYVHSAIQVPGV